MKSKRELLIIIQDLVIYYIYFLLYKKIKKCYHKKMYLGFLFFLFFQTNQWPVGLVRCWSEFSAITHSPNSDRNCYPSCFISFFLPFLKHFLFLLLFSILYTWIKRNITSTCKVNQDFVIHYSTSCMSHHTWAIHSHTHASVCMSEWSCSFQNIFKSTMSQCELQHCLNIL